ncbi:lytic transglycosylase domain-containing protein [Streptomyces sp. NA04227]|uniref:lytic transglycosylase domain-containing protein n=1 Tax=Streptomyces sp. NA04227 TaxID=2742136 RepID=UPI001591062E|nr:lytic transglycosylase domain-containing protein [Streptomyces sp. NA04227]QKW06244.1 lytic transglycosylase domain-containing protein [Streptomyces sp. NA04227]
MTRAVQSGGRSGRSGRSGRLARLRHSARGTAVAVAAVALLTASQAPGLVPEKADRARSAGGTEGAGSVPAPEGVPVQGDDSYHTELPPLTVDEGIGLPPQVGEIQAQSGIPRTVLAAYRAAEAAVRRSDPGCRLPWYLLAAIGKVESGQARGGAVTADGTTRGRIVGPALNGEGFALIRDSDNGVHDGDAVYDRAVGPMQFLPTTWARWGADGNGDGRSDPNNVFDAALAAGRYLCAGDQDLSVRTDLDRAVLSYNHSTDYLQLVLYWMEFYRSGVHSVPDGKGVIPASPGAGGRTPATRPVGGGIIVGPQPGGPGDPSGPSRPTDPSDPATPSDPDRPDRPDPSSGTDPDPDPTDTGGPSPDPTGSATPGPSGEPTPSDPGEPSGCPTDSASPTPTDSPSPSPDPSPGDDPCESPSPSPSTST